MDGVAEQFIKYPYILKKPPKKPSITKLAPVLFVATCAFMEIVNMCILVLLCCVSSFFKCLLNHHDVFTWRNESVKISSHEFECTGSDGIFPTVMQILVLDKFSIPICKIFLLGTNSSVACPHSSQITAYFWREEPFNPLPMGDTHG